MLNEQRDDGLDRVSIRAPLARGDTQALQKPLPEKSFNPRPSCEGRLPLPK